MNIEKTKLVCIKEPITGTYTVYAKEMPGIIIQSDDLQSIPAQMADAYQAFLSLGFIQGIHEMIEPDK